MEAFSSTLFSEPESPTPNKVSKEYNSDFLPLLSYPTPIHTTILIRKDVEQSMESRAESPL